MLVGELVLMLFVELLVVSCPLVIEVIHYLFYYRNLIPKVFLRKQSHSTSSASVAFFLFSLANAFKSKYLSGAAVLYAIASFVTTPLPHREGAGGGSLERDIDHGEDFRGLAFCPVQVVLHY